jgi:drug/metabolite transporter (DMT)-like permease
VAIATVSMTATAVLIGVIVGDLDPLPAPQSLGWLALLGLTSQSAGYLLISLSLPRLPAVLTSIILLTQPVATVGLSVVLLGEQPSQIQLAGVALVVGGIAVAMLGGRPAAARARRRAAAES